MKRIITVFLALLLVFGLMLGDVQPVSASTYVVSLDSPYKVAIDSDFITYVRTSTFNNLTTCRYDIVFDPALLRLDDVTNGLMPVISWDFISPGRYTIIQEKSGGIGDIPGSFALLHFHVVSSQVVNASISIVNGVIRYWNGDPMTATWTNDSVSIYQPTEIVSTIPTNNANEIALNTSIMINFSEAMNTTLTQTAFSICPDVAGSFTWDNGTVMKFIPDSPLDYGTVYTVTLYKSAVDINGNPISGNFVFSFTTVPLRPEVITEQADSIKA